jgi:hypothetical protein
MSLLQRVIEAVMVIEIVVVCGFIVGSLTLAALALWRKVRA